MSIKSTYAQYYVKNGPKYFEICKPRANDFKTFFFLRSAYEERESIEDENDEKNRNPNNSYRFSKTTATNHFVKIFVQKHLRSKLFTPVLWNYAVIELYSGVNFMNVDQNLLFLKNKKIKSNNISKKMIVYFFRSTRNVATIPLEDERTVNSEWYKTIRFPEVIDENWKNNRKCRINLPQDNQNPI